MASAVTPVRSAPDDLFDVGVRQGEGSGFVGTMPWSGPVLGPDGTPAVGALGVLVDEVLGYSLIASLPPGSWTVSTEIWVDVVAPLPTTGGTLVARGAALQPGSFASGQVHDQDGTLVAVVRERGRQIADGPTPGTPVLPTRLAPAVSLAAALGAEPVGPAQLVVAPSLVLANPRGVVHGGISFAASELAASTYRLAAGSALRTSSVHIAQVRAVPVETPYELRVETVHAGRSLWLSEVRGYSDGRLCTVSRVTAE
ncbi:MAG: hypothetical protein JWN84_3556 [Nocardioides sp.]|nr:hypothetical protein [Nocardioides sp.]